MLPSLKRRRPFVLGFRDPRGHPEEAEATFEFILARDLGMTVAELRRRMSTREFAEWLAFYSVENREQERLARQAVRKQGRR